MCQGSDGLQGLGGCSAALGGFNNLILILFLKVTLKHYDIPTRDNNHNSVFQMGKIGSDV